MIDIGLSKMALIGAVALVVIGPEKLPRVARTVGALLGKAQRYVADVKAEVNQAMELDELRRMKQTVEDAARDVQQSVRETAAELEQDLNPDFATPAPALTLDAATTPAADPGAAVLPLWQPPRKNWRLKRAAVPRWYKARAGVRSHVQSAAARVARFRPKSRSKTLR